MKERTFTDEGKKYTVAIKRDITAYEAANLALLLNVTGRHGGGTADEALEYLGIARHFIIEPYDKPELTTVWQDFKALFT